MSEPTPIRVGQIVRYTSPTGYQAEAVVDVIDRDSVAIKYVPEGRVTPSYEWVPIQSLDIPQ